LLTFRENVVKELNALLKNAAQSALSADLLKSLIPEVIKNWTEKEDAKDVSVLLNKKDLDSVQSSLTASLKAELAKGLRIQMSEEVVDGFRLSLKDGEAFYDFSSESIASLFSSYLNPQTAKIMKEASQTMGN
jgi:V/A-type H+-transporting ATPase subunit E